MEKELPFGLSKRKSLEIEIMKLQVKMHAKSVNVLHSIDIGDFGNF